MNGNGKLTETEDVIFYVSYGILTDERKRNAENQGPDFRKDVMTIS